MAIEFKLPDLGENIDDADVLTVLVKEGDTVTEDQGIIEVETEKATMEVPSPAAGTITSINVKEGDTIKPGQLVAVIEPGEAAAKADATAEAEAEEEPEQSDDPPADEETEAEAEPADEDPAESPEPARASDDTSDDKPQSAPEPEQDEPAAPEPESRNGGSGIPVSAAPSVRKLAREIGVDVRNIEGSGPGGRISVEDVKSSARSGSNGSGPAAGARLRPEPLPDFSRYGAVDRQPMTRVRRATAENLAKSWSTIPHVTIFEKVDVSALEDFRKRYRGSVEASGGKLTFTAILLKIVAAALKSHPSLNASIDIATQEIVYKNYYHLGVAADTDRGLLVPVIRDVDKKSIVELSVELAELAGLARSGKLPLDKMQGASFTVSNLGPMRTGFFTPIINPPEVAILGVGRIADEPVVTENGIEARKTLSLALSFDHRLVDGADGARFMAWLVDAINEPLLLALEG